MGIGNFFKSFVSSEALGDETIATQERMYRRSAAKNPAAEPHLLLAEVWLNRMAAHGNKTDNESFRMMAFSETAQFACLPPLKNARALGLYFLYKERKDVLERFPKFGQEFDALMAPIVHARGREILGTIQKLPSPHGARRAQ